MIRRKSLALAVLAIGLGPLAAQATPIVEFAFDSDTSATYMASNIESATLDASGLDNAVIGDDGFGDVFEVYLQAGGVSAETAVSTDSFFSVTLTAASGQTLGFNTLTLEVGKGGSSDPRGFGVRSDLGDFATDIGFEQLPTGASAAPAPYSFSLGGGFADLTSAVFRFYVYTPNSSSNSVDFGSIAFSEAPAAVPAPLSLALLASGVAALAGLRRRAA